jgi:hypothetical protein
MERSRGFWVGDGGEGCILPVPPATATLTMLEIGARFLDGPLEENGADWKGQDDQLAFVLNVVDRH